MEAGAVYSPVPETVPVPAGLILQFACVLALPVTVAVNCCVCDANRFAVPGATFTATEIAYLKSTGTYMRPAVAATAVYVPFRKYTAAAKVPSLVVCAVGLLSYHASPPWVCWL